ncbi:hypothetical protein Gotur_011950, partial [Gossypium turneri]
FKQSYDFLKHYLVTSPDSAITSRLGLKWIIGMLWNDIGLYIVVNYVLALAVGYTTSKVTGGSGCWR